MGCITVDSGIFGVLIGQGTIAFSVITYQWTKSCYWKSVFTTFPPPSVHLPVILQGNISHLYRVLWLPKHFHIHDLISKLREAL